MGACFAVNIRCYIYWWLDVEMHCSLWFCLVMPAGFVLFFVPSLSWRSICTLIVLSLDCSVSEEPWIDNMMLHPLFPSARVRRMKQDSLVSSDRFICLLTSVWCLKSPIWFSSFSRYYLGHAFWFCYCLDIRHDLFFLPQLKYKSNVSIAQVCGHIRVVHFGAYAFLAWFWSWVVTLMLFIYFNHMYDFIVQVYYSIIIHLTHLAR